MASKPQGDALMADDETEADEEQLNAIHELLSKRRRRDALRVLRDHGPQTKSDLAAAVAANEYGKRPEELTNQEHHRIEISLHQQHLPALEKHGFVEWEQTGNSEDDVVRLGAESEEILRYLDGVDEKRSFGDIVSSLF